MNYSLLFDIPNILERFTNRYLYWRGYNSPGDINCGECFIWAWYVHHYLKRRGIESNLVSCMNYGGHAWVEINGVAYDSNSLDGITHDEMVYNFLGFDETDEECWGEDWDGEGEAPEIISQEEDEFFEHWSGNGGGGFLFLMPEFMSRMSRVIAQCGRGYQKVS